MKAQLKRCCRLLVAATACCVVAVATGANAPPLPAEILLTPGSVVIVSVDDCAWLIHAPADGSVPMVAAAFRFGSDVEPLPDPTPDPRQITGLMIVENQEDRTAAQAAVMDDPIWQAAATAAKLTWLIEDKDHPRAAPMLEAIRSPLPVVCFLDEYGAVVKVVPLPATVEKMRALIGGVK